MRFGRRTVESCLLLLACGAGVVVRVWLASRGHNFDMESWDIAAGLVVEGKNVYANTYRHPYGPPWFLMLGGLRWIHDSLGLERLGPESFHMVIAAFLSLADVGIAILLFLAFGLIPALFFILNPVSMLITGYHSQIDALALLPGFAAWLLLCARAGPRAKVSWTRLVGSALLLGLSLATKHVLLFFPVWIIFCPTLVGALWRRIVYAAIAYACAAAICLPFLFGPLAWTGFRKYVLDYTGLAANHTLLLHLIDLFIPPNLLDTLFGLTHGVSALNRLFIVLMLLAGWFIAGRKPGELFYCYLLAIVVLAVSMADQYLAVPLIACAVYWRRWPAWVYLLPATLLLWFAAADAGALPQPAPRWHPYTSHLSYVHAQVWAAILLMIVLLRRRDGPVRGP